MIIIEYKSSGNFERELNSDEVKILAKNGNKEALRELILLKGGWEVLTQTQKEKITKILLGFQEDFD